MKNYHVVLILILSAFGGFYFSDDGTWQPEEDTELASLGCITDTECRCIDCLE